MIRTLLIVSGLLVAGGLFVWGKELPNVVRTATEEVKSCFKDEVSPEFEIKRARKMIADLGPEIQASKKLIASQEVDIEIAERNLAQRVVRLDKQKKVLLTLREALKQSQQEYVFAGVPYTPAEVKADLERRYAAYVRAEQSVEREKKILEARKRTLAANREKLENLMAARQKLEVQIEELEAKLKALEAVEAADRLKLDDSQLSRTQKLIDEIEKELKVREKLLDEKGFDPGHIRVEEQPQRDVTEAIDEHFQQTPGHAIESEL